MNKKTLIFLFLIVFSLVQNRVDAVSLVGIQLYITNEFIYQYNELAEEKNQFYELLSFSTDIKKWSFGLTLRGFNFYQQDPNTTLENLTGDIYRFFIRYDSKYFKVNAGDFYSLLGRGLVLSVLKNEDVLRERTITGGDISFIRGNVNFRILGGLVRDETEDQLWAMAAGESDLELIKNHHLGIHFSYINDIESQLQMGKRMTTTFSLNGDKILECLSYYLEAGWLDFLESDSYFEDGYGIYANFTFNQSHITGFAEYKKYKNFYNGMNNPPVGDREDEISEIMDTEGFRLYFQYAVFEPDLRLFLNYGRYQEYEDKGDHIYGGLIVEDLWDRLDVSLSYGERDITYPIKKFNLDLEYRISSRMGIQFSTRDKHYRDGDFIFSEQDQSLQFSFAPLLALYVMHQYSHNKVMDLNHFYSGGIKLTLKGGTVVELSVGTVRGGEVCSAGQCFVMPPFKGIRFSIFHIFK